STNPAVAAASNSAAKSLSLTWPLGSASSISAPGRHACAASWKNFAASGNSCTIANANVKSTVFFDIAEPHRLGRCNPRIDAFEQICLGGAPLQIRNHLRLKIDNNHATSRTNQARERKCEESHSRPRLEHGHSFANIRPKNFDGILAQPRSHGTREQVSNPAWANTMRHDGVISLPARHS